MPFFVFVRQLDCAITETRARELIFDIALDSKLRERLDFYEDLYAKLYKTKTSKIQVGLYEIEEIDNPTVITVALHPKEHLEKCKNKDVHKENTKKACKKAQLAWILTPTPEEYFPYTIMKLLTHLFPMHPFSTTRKINLEMFLLLTKILNIFPGSVEQASVHRHK